MNEEIQEFQPIITIRIGESVNFFEKEATEMDCGRDSVCKIKIEEILERVS